VRRRSADTFVALRPNGGDGFPKRTRRKACCSDRAGTVFLVPEGGATEDRVPIRILVAWERQAGKRPGRSPESDAVSAQGPKQVWVVVRDRRTTDRGKRRVRWASTPLIISGIMAIDGRPFIASKSRPQRSRGQIDGRGRSTERPNLIVHGADIQPSFACASGLLGGVVTYSLMAIGSACTAADGALEKRIGHIPE